MHHALRKYFLHLFDLLLIAKLNILTYFWKPMNVMKRNFQLVVSYNQLFQPPNSIDFSMSIPKRHNRKYTMTSKEILILIYYKYLVVGASILLLTGHYKKDESLKFYKIQKHLAINYVCFNSQ